MHGDAAKRGVNSIAELARNPDLRAKEGSKVFEGESSVLRYPRHLLGVEKARGDVCRG